MQLRYYQEDCVRETFRYINGGGRAGIAVLPTASGKSLIIADIVMKILTKKNHVRIMMLTHVKELIEQNFEKLKTIWPTAPAGIYSASVGRRQFHNPIIFGGIQSCYRKPEIFGHIDMIIVDEAHLISDKAESMYGKFISDLRKKNPQLVVIGLTATPYRLGMGYLTSGPVFDDIYYDISTMDSFVRLIDEGFLCDLIPLKTEHEYDVSGIKKIGGDFSEKELDAKLNLEAVTVGVVQETIKHIEDRNKGIAFCINVDHATNMCRIFNENGVSSKFVNGKMNKGEREKIINGFRNGEFKVLTNVGVATTGLDVPDIDFIVLARPTESTALHIQMLGRGMRVHPSKQNTLVLDYAGNTERLGPVNDPVVKIPGQKGMGDAPIRICDALVLKNDAPGCGAINHASVRTCKYCGAEFIDPQIKIKSVSQTEALIRRSDLPMFNEFPVSAVAYARHFSAKGNEVLKVSFICGPSVFDKYLTIDKSSKAYYPSMSFLNKLGITEKPSTNDEALALLEEKMRKPDKIKVWMNKPVAGKDKKYKEIMEVIYESSD